MWTVLEQPLTRRAVIRLGLTTAALAALPLPNRRVARAEPSAPHFFVTFDAEGGWDVTQVFDPHDPADATDGVDVDVPTEISGLPPSQIVAQGPLTHVSNPATRPAVDAFFQAWAARSAIVNGINTRSTSHDQSAQLVLTGYLDPTRADFPVMAAHRHGDGLPLPHIHLSGPSFAGAFAGLSGRLGGQMSSAIAYNRLLRDRQLVVSTAGEQYVQQALARAAALDEASGDVVGGRLGEFAEAQVRADRLASLAQSLPSGSDDGAQLAAALGAAFRQGLTTSVSVQQVGGFDTHSDNTQQNDRWQDLFTFLTAFVGGLAAQPGVLAPSLLDETTIVYVSEFGRTPRLNTDLGKDHHPWNSMLLVGKRVRPGVFGVTDGEQKGVKVDLATGQPSDTGTTIDVTNVVAGLLVLASADPGAYLPAGVRPLTAFVGA